MKNGKTPPISMENTACNIYETAIWQLLSLPLQYKNQLCSALAVGHTPVLVRGGLSPGVIWCHERSEAENEPIGSLMPEYVEYLISGDGSRPWYPW